MFITAIRKQDDQTKKLPLYLNFIPLPWIYSAVIDETVFTAFVFCNLWEFGNHVFCGDGNGRDMIAMISSLLATECGGGTDERTAACPSIWGVCVGEPQGPFCRVSPCVRNVLKNDCDSLEEREEEVAGHDTFRK